MIRQHGSGLPLVLLLLVSAAGWWLIAEGIVMLLGWLEGVG
jgi:hypothetical protein